MNIRNFSDVKSLFLDNKTLRQTIFKNTFWLALAEGITRLLKLVLIIYIARILGATEYGKFAFGLAFVSLFAIFSDFGLSQIVIREFSREKEKEKEFPTILSLKIFLGLGVLTLMLIGSFFVTSDSVIRKVIWILAIYISITNFVGIIYVFLRARQQMEYEAFAKILQAVVLAGLGLFVILNFPSIKNLSSSYLFASTIALIFILMFFHLKIFPLKLSFKRTIWKHFLAMSWPLGFAMIFDAIYSHLDSTMMGYFGQIIQTGWYNAASKIVKFTFIPTFFITQSFFAPLSIAFKESKEKLQRIWNFRTEIVIFLGMPITVGGIVLAPKIINFVYGPDFSPSILAFQILIITSGIFFLITALRQALIVSNQQSKTFWISLSGAIANIILNLILIPHFSLYGAALAALITYLLILYLFFRFTLSFTPINPFNLRIWLSFVGTSFSGILMYLVISRPKIYHLNIFLSILIGGLVYLISYLIYRKLINQFRFN